MLRCGEVHTFTAANGIHEACHYFLDMFRSRNVVVIIGEVNNVIHTSPQWA
ncbi:hypothetical protein D3C84_1234730 [compost metagenome]